MSSEAPPLYRCVWEELHIHLISTGRYWFRPSATTKLAQS